MARSEAAQRPRPVPQKGGRFFKGLLVGTILGVGLSLAVAIYVTHLRSPFVPHFDASSDKPEKPAADLPEVARNGLVNPVPVTGNAGSSAPSNNQEQASPGPAQASPAAEAAAPAPASEPSVTYFVQTGAFKNQAEADNQRATMALIGVDAAILSPEVGDNPQLYRVRVGPIVSLDEVRTLVATLKNNGIQTTVIKSKSKTASSR